MTSISAAAPHFGMFKRKIEKAKERYERVSANPNATAQDKKDAFDYSKRMEKASEEPRQFHTKTGGFLKDAQRLTTGLIGAAVASSSAGHDQLSQLIPDPSQEKFAEGAIGVVGTLTGDKIGATGRKSATDRLTDKMYPESTYPKASSAKMKTDSNYFDEDGNRWTLPARHEDKLNAIEDREQRARGALTKTNSPFMSKEARERILREAREEEQEELLKKHGRRYGFS